jgi:hypothetical protein
MNALTSQPPLPPGADLKSIVELVGHPAGTERA